MVVLALAAAVGWSGFRVLGPPAAVSSGAPATIEVQPGDTLWTIARRTAPEADTRGMVDQLKRRNGLPDGAVRAGQRLVLHP
ncbi:MAG: LysM peptidoglycan-binding domain-containing protein [Actinobacteria bacterium]|nr:LysM peptidoglycan-binding domain-containing protein [Actinomycetota bacterium]